VGGELQLTDGIRRLMKKEDVHGVLYRGKRYDVGDRAGWLAANVELALQRGDVREELLPVLRRILAQPASAGRSIPKARRARR
jgi:UTP--glucose-1-phosphate uridylyltransferase